MDPKDWSEQIAVAAFVVDDHGRICAANAAFRTLVGDSDVVGRALLDLAPDDLELVGGSPDGKRLSLIDLLALPRRVRTSNVCIARGRLRRPDGLVLEVVFRALALHDGQGADAGRRDAVLVSSVDASGWNERALRLPDTNSEHVYQAIFEHSPIGILRFDPRGVLTACNDVLLRILGSTRQQVMGLDLHTLPNPEMRACVSGALAGAPTVFAGDYVSATGNKPSVVRAEFAPIFDGQATIVGGVALVQDITEQRATERAAARADRMASLATLAAGTVHEMQNPLALTVTSGAPAQGERAERARDRDRRRPAGRRSDRGSHTGSVVVRARRRRAARARGRRGGARRGHPGGEAVVP